MRPDFVMCPPMGSAQWEGNDHYALVRKYTVSRIPRNGQYIGCMCTRWAIDESFWKVCSSCIWRLRKANHVSKCSDLTFWVSPHLNILCTGSLKQCHSKSTHNVYNGVPTVIIVNWAVVTFQTHLTLWLAHILCVSCFYFGLPVFYFQFFLIYEIHGIFAF